MNSTGKCILAARGPVSSFDLHLARDKVDWLLGCYHMLQHKNIAVFVMQFNFKCKQSA